jgi:hypothetical protein
VRNTAPIRSPQLKKANGPETEKPGIAFEKVVAAIQAQIDPSATVSHNEFLTDRLGQRRQFDVVVRGTFAGQQMVGIIECKDLRGKVDTPAIDAFVTKAQDINANFKVIVSRRGFSKPALAKCVHYGVQALSLVDNDPANRQLFIGTRWEADVIRWARLALTLHFVDEPAQPVHFDAGQVTIAGKKVVDWFTNYLIDNSGDVSGFGWVMIVKGTFDKPQTVTVREGEQYECSAITFSAERICQKLERYVGISGTGFFNWLEQKVTFPLGAQIRTDGVPMDFAEWEPRTDQQRPATGFLDVKLEVHSTFERIPDAIQLDTL